MKTTRFLQITYGLMLLAIMFVFSDCARAQVVVKIQDPTGLYTALKNATTLSANQTVYFPKSIDGKTVVVVNAFSSTQTFQAGDIPYASTSVNYLMRLSNPGADTFYLGLSGGLPHWNDKDWVTQVPSGPNENNIFPTSTGLVNLSLQSAGGSDDLLDFMDNSGGVISNFDNTGKLYYGGDPVLSLDGLSIGNDGAVVYDGTIGNNFASVNGTAGYVLTSNGAGTLPTFQAATGGGSIDTNYVVTHPNVTTSTSHNWIIPSVDAIPLRLENIVGGVADMFGVLYNSGLTESLVFTIGNTGDLTIAPHSDIVPLSLNQFGGGTSDALQIDGSTVFNHAKNLPVARLNSGTSASGSTFWRGDGTWATPSAGMTNPMTTLGDVIYEDATPIPARLAGNTTSTKKFLTQTGTGTISAVPAWGTLVSGDIPDLSGSYIKNQHTAQSTAGFNITDNANTIEAQIATTYTAGGATALKLISNNTNGGHANYGLAFDVAGGATNFDLIGSSSTWSMTNAGVLALGSALTVANGGTGAATLAANNVLLGNGTTALQTVAPSTSGNVLTSNGTTWASTAPAASFTAAQTVTIDNIIQTPTDGIVIQNTQAATSGVPIQYSPRLRLSGQAWKGSTSTQVVDGTIEMRPINAATDVSPEMVFCIRSNTNAFDSIFKLQRDYSGSAPTITLGSNLSPGVLLRCQAKSSSGSGGQFQIQGQDANGSNQAADNIRITMGRGTGTGQSGTFFVESGFAGASGSSLNTARQVLAISKIGTAASNPIAKVTLGLSSTITGLLNICQSAAGNATCGTGTLASGTVTISTTAVATGDLIFLTDVTGGTNIGTVSVGTIVNGTSFVVTSTNILDNSSFNWLIIRPN